MVKKLLINGVLIYIGAGVLASVLTNVLEVIPYIVIAINVFAPIFGCIAIKLNSKKKVIKKPKLNISKIKWNISINFILVVFLGLYLSEANFVSIGCQTIENGAISIIVMSILWNIMSKFIKLPTFTECWKAFI